MKFLCVLCVLCGLGSYSLALDREAITITKYDLKVGIEPEQERLTVRGTIRLRNQSAVSQKNLALQISSSLTWRSIRLAETPLEFVSQLYTSDVDHTGSLSEAIVTLPEALAPGASLDLTVGYEGTIPPNVVRLTRIGFPDEVARRSDWDRIGSSFTAVRGIGYVAWYPIATEAANLSEKNAVFDTVARFKDRESQAEMRLHFDYPAHSKENPPQLLCDGIKSGETSEGLGRLEKFSADCAFSPLGAVVPTFVLADYDQTSGHVLDIYSLPGHISMAEFYAASAERVAPFSKDWFGPVQGKAMVAELPGADSIAFESGNLWLTPLAGADDQHIALTAARQFAHSAIRSPRLWISEGLAHFAQALYREQQDGRAAALAFMRPPEEVMLAAEKDRASADQEPARNSLINTSVEEFYRSKGMYVWWMLRDIVGEQTLKSALAAYRPEQDKEPSYMQRLVEAAYKKDLEWFFDDWVYRDKGIPDFRVVSVYPRRNLKEGYLTTVTVENLGDAAAEVPVIIHDASGDITERLLIKGKSQASVRFSTHGVPDLVTVNDGSVPESDVSNNTFKIEPAAVDNH